MSGILAMVLTIFKHETIHNMRKALEKEELSFIAVSMIMGGLIFFETIAEKTWSIHIIQTALGAVLFLTIIEEYIKHLIVRFIDDKKLKDIDDAITLSIMVGLAFALIETAIYAISSGDLSLIISSLFTLFI